LLTWILGLYGYINKESITAGQEIIQPNSVINGVKMLVSVYPSIPFLFGAGLLFFYAINKKMENEIEQKLSDRRAKENL